MKLGKYKLLATLYLQTRLRHADPETSSGLSAPSNRHPEFILRPAQDNGEPVESISGSGSRNEFGMTSTSFLRELVGPSHASTLSRLINQNLVKKSPATPSLRSASWRRSNLGEIATATASPRDDDGKRGLQITYPGTNALLSRFPLLDYFRVSAGHAERESTRSISEGDSSGRIPLPAQAGQDDKSGVNFTLVVFNVPEEKRQVRDRLRYILKTLFFGQINRSLYITPHLSVKEAKHLAASAGNPDGFLVFSVPISAFPAETWEGLSFGAEDNPFGAFGSFWDLREVKRLYERALVIASEARQSGLEIASGRTPRNDGVSGRFLNHYLDALLMDPLLPPPLLPKDWVGTRSLDIAKRILT